MIIVDFKYESVKQENVKTSQFKTADDVVRFAADMSLKHTHFRIERINKYVNGSLIPMEITVNKGRIELIPKVEPMNDTEARMRMIAEHQAKISGKIHDDGFEF